MASRAYEAAIDISKTTLWIRWSLSVALVPLLGVLGYLATDGDVPMALPSSFQIAIFSAAAGMAGMCIALPRMMLPKRAIIAHMRAARDAKAPRDEYSDAMAPREERLA